MHPLLQRTEDLIPTKAVSTPYGEILFYLAGRVCLYRAETFHTKEPETLRWINEFKDGEVLWDIGANIGCYSLYAARKGHRVIAFEPSGFNYFILMKNIGINQLDDRISALPIALSDHLEIADLQLQYLEVGDSCHDYVPYGTPHSPRGLRQTTIAFSIDDLTRSFPLQYPNHIKIDVDGIDIQILMGAKNTLADRRVKSVLIEIESPEQHDVVTTFMKELNFSLAEREHSELYKDSPIYNYIFNRT
jgi:FkbM family methyltransferase